jgi:hypothetical protein
MSKQRLREETEGEELSFRFYFFDATNSNPVPLL